MQYKVRLRNNPVLEPHFTLCRCKSDTKRAIEKNLELIGSSLNTTASSAYLISDSLLSDQISMPLFSHDLTALV